MGIYSKYGAMYPDVQEELYYVEQDAFKVFRNHYKHLSLETQRMLFHEFLSGLHCRFAEHQLKKSLELSKQEKEHDNQ